MFFSGLCMGPQGTHKKEKRTEAKDILLAQNKQAKQTEKPAFFPEATEHCHSSNKDQLRKQVSLGF